jgi:inhibitor of KinA sporulation pathway (predicted exonuclease)
MARPRIDQIIVVDLEATCWATHEAPQGQAQEIIEIGYALIDTFTKSIIGDTGHSLIVKPTESKVSEFCTQLTGWTQEAVDQGMSFPSACYNLQDGLDSKYRTWVSWGNFDYRLFTEQCKRRGVSYPFSYNYINAMNLAALKFGWKKGRGMMKALTALNIPHTGKHHNGGDDAFNIAKIVCKTLWG